jgi:putative hydrolase of the HAD superfamily
MNTTEPPGLPPPRAVLCDYGGTLVRDVPADLRSGNAWLLAQASFVPPGVTLDDVVERALRVGRDIARRRDETQIEVPWPALARLTHDFFGIRFDKPLAELELGFWQAAVRTAPLAGAEEALRRLRDRGLPLAVISNTSSSEEVIRFALAQHHLAEHLSFVIVSSAYGVRKPNPWLYEVAAARLGVDARDVWFIGDRLDTDVAGARAAGMTAVWFNPAAAGDSQQRADVCVQDWEAFSRLAAAE